MILLSQILCLFNPWISILEEQQKTFFYVNDPFWEIRAEFAESLNYLMKLTELRMMCVDFLTMAKKQIGMEMMIWYAYHDTQCSDPFAISLDGTDVADIIIQVIPRMEGLEDYSGICLE